MKVWIVRNCGHEEQINVFGNAADREARIRHEESKPCIRCYQAEKYKDFDEVKMCYSEYKSKYPGYKTKAGSYDAKEKTIIVFVPRHPVEGDKLPDTSCIEGRKAAIEMVAAETGLPHAVIENIFMKYTADQYIWNTEECAEQLKKLPDKTGKHENAYIGAITLGNIAKKYGL